MKKDDNTPVPKKKRGGQPGNKGGRPKESVSDKVDYAQVERMAEKGLTESDIAHILGLTRQTLYNYKDDEQFLLHLKRGKAKSDARVVKSLFKRAVGFYYNEEHKGMYDGILSTKSVRKYAVPDTTAQIFWLKNRKPDEWRDKQQVEHSIEAPTVQLFLPDNGRGGFDNNNLDK